MPSQFTQENYQCAIKDRFNKALSSKKTTTLQNAILAHVVCYDRITGAIKYGAKNSDKFLSFKILINGCQFTSKVDEILCKDFKKYITTAKQVDDRYVFMSLIWKNQEGLDDGEYTRLLGYSELDIYKRYLHKDMFISKIFESVLSDHIRVIADQIMEHVGPIFVYAKNKASDG